MTCEQKSVSLLCDVKCMLGYLSEFYFSSFLINSEKWDLQACSYVTKFCFTRKAENNQKNVTFDYTGCDDTASWITQLSLRQHLRTCDRVNIATLPWTDHFQHKFIYIHFTVHFLLLVVICWVAMSRVSCFLTAVNGISHRETIKLWTEHINAWEQVNRYVR